LRYVLFYEAAQDVSEKIPLHLEAHRAWWRGFRERGELLLVGPFTDQSGAMSVFTTEEAAHAFAEGDPFVTGGLVRGWQVKEWMEAIGEPSE
jgi:uncharacterized protein YciI